MDDYHRVNRALNSRNSEGSAIEDRNSLTKSVWIDDLMDFPPSPVQLIGPCREESSTRP